VAVVASSRIRRTLPALFILLGTALAGPALAAESLEGTVVDRRGRPVVCEAAVLVEREVVTACDDEGRFVLALDTPIAADETLVVYAPGHRDQVLSLAAGTTTQEVTLRRGRSRRSQSTVWTDTSWRLLERRQVALDVSPEPGTAAIDAARHAETAGGYGDVNRTLHSLPGISGDTAASARFRVRGAEPHETLTFIDGIRIIDATHLGGLFGALDPDLATRVTVQGLTPSATVPDSLGGAVTADYLDAPRNRFDGAVDLSFLGVGAYAAADLGREPGRGVRVVVGARRSLLQAYLGAFKGLGVVDIPLDVVDFGSAYGKVSIPTGDDGRLRISLVHLHDRALFDDVNLRHRVLGGAARWDLTPGPRTRVFVHAHWGWEDQGEPATDNEYPGKRTWNEARHRGRFLAGVDQGFGPAHVLRVGIEGGPVLRRAEGELIDVAHRPSWAALPAADLVSEQFLDSQLTRDHGELDLYAEAEFVDLGPVTLRGGARVTLLSSSLRPRVSPRLGVALPLPTGTVVRGGLALTHQDRPDLALLGAPQERPERALTGSIAVAQAFSDVATLEVTGWGRALDHLLVTDGVGGWGTTGTGLAGGVDVSWLVQLGRFETHGSWSLLATQRNDGGLSGWGAPRPTAGDQRHDVEVGARVFVGKLRNFMIGGGYSGASGPPSSTLSPINQGGDAWLWQVDGLNDRRLAATHRIDLRLEHRIPTRLVRLRASFELNADLGGRVFLENCDAVGEDGAPPACGALTFWPAVRPWLGLKAEW